MRSTSSPFRGLAMNMIAKELRDNADTIAALIGLAILAIAYLGR
jgi:hypothetical protein